MENYLNLFHIGDEDFVYRTSDYGLKEKVIDYLNGIIDAEEVREESFTVRDAQSLEGLIVTLNHTYRDYYVTVINAYRIGTSWGVDIYGGDSNSVRLTQNIPFGDHDSFVIIISSVPWDALVNNPSLVDTEELIVGGVGIQSYVEMGDIDIPVINPSDYIQTLTINGETDISNVAVDRSVFLEEMFIEEMISPLTNGKYSPSEEVTTIELILKPEFAHLYVFTYRTIDYQGIFMPIDVYDSRQSPMVFELRELPYGPVASDDFIFILSPVPMEYIESEEDINNLIAFGVGFGDVVEEEPEDDLPPEIVNPTDLDSTQYIEVLNGTTLEHYSYVPDVYNVKISQTINGPYTLSFNLQPYTNASNIYTPRIVHCDGEYFHVQQITKRSQLENLEMDVLCEHVSYELNYPPQSFWDEVAEKYVWTEDTYVGTASEILEELLEYNNRFSIGTVDNDMTEHTFTTSSEGFRTRINEFAAQIGLEVRWDKFTISLLRKRGRDHGLTLEVGKNIVGLTEIIDTVKLGKVQRSYEIEALDLNYVYDESNAPIEVHNIVLGDVLTIVDENYRIQRKDRVVSISRDPFQKALPTVEFLNNVNSFTADSVNNDKIKGVGNIKLPIYQKDITRHETGNAFGEYTEAGRLAFAEGYGTTALGPYSHSEGYITGNTASFSHSEGFYTQAHGVGSHVEGGYTYASNYYAHAEGESTKAIGYSSHSEGFSTTARGSYSHSEGYFTNAEGSHSHSEGINTMASGNGSHSAGASTTASGLYTYASGFGCIASDYVARATGYHSQATNHSAFAHGYEVVASGTASASFGRDTIANTGASFVIGCGNKELNGRENSSSTSIFDAFVIGNGSAEYRSNGLRVTFGGNTYVQGAYFTTGADYSEFFEWFDGNPNNEDRKGLVVTFEGDKIRLANANDEYILGIVSVNPSIIGNSFEDQWNGMYITDEWGNIEHHYVDVPFEEPDENGETKTVYRQSYLPKINPNYNPEQAYTPRSQRQEWATVGMLGKLLVRDDGTCQINKYARLSETVDGVLSNSTERTQFFVLRRVSENVVEVLIK